jgi:hypothetical protein
VQLLGDNNFSLRLNSCLGFCLGSAILWRLLARKFGIWPSTIAVYALTLGSSQVIDHNCEARCYGMLFFEFSLATWIYASLCEKRNASWLMFVANSLVHAALVTTHYLGFGYGLVFMLANCAVFARDVRSAATRCISIAAGWLFFVPCIPGLMCQAELGKHSCILRPTLRHLFNVYNVMDENLMPLLLTLVAVALLILVVRNTITTTSETMRDGVAVKPLLILALSILVLPAAVWLVSQSTTSLFMARYFLAPLLVCWEIVLAICVRAIYSSLLLQGGVAKSGSWIVTKWLSHAAFVALLVFYIGFANRTWIRARQGIFDEVHQSENETLKMIDGLPRDVPIAFLELFEFAVIDRYSDRRSQFALLVDREWSFGNSPDVSRFAANCCDYADALKRQYEAPVSSFDRFLKEHDRFVLIRSNRPSTLCEKWFAAADWNRAPLATTSMNSAVLIERKTPGRDN